LSFLVLALIVILVPLVNKIVFPGSGEIDFITKQVKDDTVDLTQDIAKTQVAMATAAEVVARSQSFLAIQLRTLTDQASRNNVATSTLLDATATVADLFRPSSVATTATPLATPEDIRVSAWVSAGGRTQLVCVIGWPEDICKPLIGLATAATGVDPASYVFQTSQSVNYPNIAIQERPPLPTVNPPIIYKGILVVPMYAGGGVSGILQIERSRAERFEPFQLNLARALSALYGMALS
jgi:GAF domain-containing protein